MAVPPKNDFFDSPFFSSSPPMSSPEPPPASTRWSFVLLAPLAPGPVNRGFRTPEESHPGHLAIGPFSAAESFPAPPLNVCSNELMETPKQFPLNCTYQIFPQISLVLSKSVAFTISDPFPPPGNIHGLNRSLSPFFEFFCLIFQTVSSIPFPRRRHTQHVRRSFRYLSVAPYFLLIFSLVEYLPSSIPPPPLRPQTPMIIFVDFLSSFQYFEVQAIALQIATQFPV